MGERASTGAHLELPDGRTASVVAQHGRTGWWLHIEVAGQRLSGALWQRNTLEAAIEAAPGLMAHWQHVMVQMYGNLSAAVEACEAYHRA